MPFSRNLVPMLRSLPNSVPSAIALLFFLFFLSLRVSSQENTRKGSEAAAKTTDAKIFSEPMVARVELRLTIGEKEVDVIEKGDLLTVLEEREKSFLIRTFRGIKGAIEKVNMVTLAESVETYDELIKQNPKAGRLYTLRAGAHWARGESDKALSDFNEAIAIGYDTANAFSSRALFLTASGQYEKAIEDFGKAIEKGDGSEATLVNRAAAYLQMNRIDEAIADYDSAININDKSAGVHQQRATAYKIKGELDRAIADFTKAIELSPNFIPATMGRGYVYFQKGDHEHAIADFTRVIELNGRAAVAFNNRGYNYQQIGKFKEAIADFNQAIELTPEYALAHQNRAWILAVCQDESLRNPKEAVAAATRACELNQYNDLSDLAALAASHAASKEFALAIGLQEKIIERAPEPQKPLAEKILELYKNEKPFNPELAVIPASENEKTIETKEGKQ